MQKKYATANKNACDGFTLIELMVVIAIVGLISMVAVPTYQDHLRNVDIETATKDIAMIALMIADYNLSNKKLPDTLDDIRAQGFADPWGNPYQYVNHDTQPPGKRRKDKNLVPINSDFDLFSMGEDGRSVAPLTAEPSRDDIVRANNGRYVGLAEDY